MAANDDVNVMPVIRDLEIPELSSQEFWDEWYPIWGKIKRQTDQAKAELASNERPDRVNPYNGLNELTPEQLQILQDARLVRACDNLTKAGGRWIDMTRGLLYPTNYNGCIGTVISCFTTLHTISDNRNSFIKDILEPLPENIKAHVCYAGGAVKNLMMGLNNTTQTDHDLFIVGSCDPREITRMMMKFLAVEHEMLNIVRTKWAISFLLKTMISGDFYRYKVQIILRHYVSPSEVVYGFDIDAAACLYHRGHYYLTPGARHSIETMEICLDVDRLSTTGVNRYLKYRRQNGFTLRIPMSWPQAYLDPWLCARKNPSASTDSLDLFECQNQNSLYSLFLSGAPFSVINSNREPVEKEDYSECTSETKAYQEQYNLFRNPACGSRTCDSQIGLIVPNPDTYIVYQNGTEMTDVIDAIFSMPKRMFGLAKYMTVPTEVDFISVNPGSQGTIGTIVKDGKVMISGSFHPVSYTWKSWSSLDDLKLKTMSTRRLNRNINDLQAAGYDPNYLYRKRCAKQNDDIAIKRKSVINRLFDLADNRSRARISELLKSNDEWGKSYRKVLNDLKLTKVKYSGQPEIIHRYERKISRTENVRLGQLHLIDRNIGLGCVVSIDSQGVLFYIKDVLYKNNDILRFVIIYWNDDSIYETLIFEIGNSDEKSRPEIEEAYNC